ncbi:hypothetical protein BJ508DRAFT_305859 [Ascobolus immersus RN42]|uniref:F-box domain-containing protein n=1 Tax=Ascobolus immersus RN42 TaxID=1160509 RepID=A0A3N4IDI5_ASCIM|nr:hypothetical protein BJ508DRAFT_305859 [Ascobolus immersus RN42]
MDSTPYTTSSPAPAPANQQATLPSLPPELLHQIATFLPTVSAYFSFKLTSRLANQITSSPTTQSLFLNRIINKTSPTPHWNYAPPSGQPVISVPLFASIIFHLLSRFRSNPYGDIVNDLRHRLLQRSEIALPQVDRGRGVRVVVCLVYWLEPPTMESGPPFLVNIEFKNLPATWLRILLKLTELGDTGNWLRRVWLEEVLEEAWGKPDQRDGVNSTLGEFEDSESLTQAWEIWEVQTGNAFRSSMRVEVILESGIA